MLKPLTISLQNLNSLYFKFLNQFILQHLPKDIYNEVVNLLSLKSAVETYRFLDKLLNPVVEKKVLNFGEQKRTSNRPEDRKAYHEADDRKDNQKRSEGYQEKSNASNQGSTSYVDKDDFKYQNDLNTISKPPTLLKRTQTYLSPQKPSLNYESYNFGQARVSRQETGSNKQTLGTVKSAVQNLSATTTINVVKHDFDTVSEKHSSLVHGASVKRQSKDNGQTGSHANVNVITDSFSFKSSRGRQNKEKSDQNLSDNGYRKTEFSKTYSIQQPEPKVLTTSGNNIPSSTPSNHLQQFSTPATATPATVNRLRFQNVIKQTKQIFSENARKIARYQKISIDVSGKTQKPSNDIYSPFSPESGHSFGYMYKKY